MLTGIRISIRDEQSGEVRARAFSRLPVRVGRNPLNDLQLDEPFISQFHAVVEVDEKGHLALRDLGSSNGTMINGQRVPPNERLGLGGSEGSFSIVQLTFEARLAAVASEVGGAGRGGGGGKGKFLAATMVADPRMQGAGAGLPPIVGKITDQATELRAALDRLHEVLAAELPRLSETARDAVVASLRQSCPEALEAPKMRGTLGAAGVFDVGGGRGVVDALRTFATSYFPRDAALSDDDLRRFIEKLQVVVGVFLKTFIPLRDGHRQFESGLNLGRSARAASAGATAVVTARDPAELGRALFDPRDEHDAAARQIEETFADLMIHEVALLGGVMRGVKALLKELSPAEIDKALTDKTHKVDVGAAWGWFRWRALWRIFATRHADYAEEEKKTFSKIFGGEFAEAYGRFVGGDGGGKHD